MGLTVLVALFAGLLVFGIWYPKPYREISGGRELFVLLVAVDVILGPLITLAVFNRTKPRSELRRDLAIVVLVQISALVYGVWTVFEARPVHLVFEIDRFRVVHAVDVPQELLEFTPRGIDALPLMGPTLLGVRPFRDEKEKMEATLVALNGLALGARPDLWQTYEATQSEVLKAAKPVTELKRKLVSQAALIDAAVSQTGRSADNLAYLPLVGRKSFWTVILDPVSTEVLAFIPLDSF